MKKVLTLCMFLLLAACHVSAQEKGVDRQNDRIRDAGTDRSPGNNGVKQNTGAGRGIDFGKGRTPTPPPIPNPYRFTIRRDIVLRAVEELMAERKLILDTSVSKTDEGVLISQPFRFVKGAVVASTELNRYAELTQENSRGWTQGRYTYIIEVLPLDATTTSVAVNARVEGRSDGASGAEWVSLRSSGIAEQELIIALVEKLTGGPPVPAPTGSSQ
ncbi:MAG TPA: hypothetical protein VK363_08585 [Pyrinomonadaceae bacterium]|nr:hypothetical protein [Pyrinomonadaceae bacterium]